MKSLIKLLQQNQSQGVRGMTTELLMQDPRRAPALSELPRQPFRPILHPSGNIARDEFFFFPQHPAEGLLDTY